MKFVFKAKTENGQEREGVVDALSREAAAQILSRNGLIPVSIQEETKQLPWIRDIMKLWEGVSQKELMVMFRQLATLVGARVPVVSSLHTLAEQTENKYLRLILKEVSDDVEDGSSLSESLEKHPAAFSELMINMIRSGEASGQLQQSIKIVAENIEKNYRLTARIRGAILYPAFVLIVASIIGFLVITFVLPKLTQVIRDMNVPIPWYTQALMWLGDFMSQYWWAVAISIFVAIAVLIYYLNTDSGRSEWNIIIFKIPVIGNLAKYVYITRFAENLSALLNGGIPVVRALMIVSNVTGNQQFQKLIVSAAEEVKSGGQISTIFIRSPLMPAIVPQMVRIGEESGTVSEVLDGVASFYTEEVDRMTANLTSLIEPVLIVALGIGVGIMVVGILMPIYNIAGQL